MSDAPMTSVIVVRHGETQWNKVGRQQGHLDSPLTELGRKQAHAIADALADEPFDVLYSSNLGRALTTAQIIAERTGHDVVVDPALRERHLGVFQGLDWQQIQQQYPAAYEAFQTGDPDYVIPDGESTRQRFNRTLAAIDRIVERHVGQRIVIVAHGGILNGLYRRTMAIDLARPRDFKLFNASINRFAVSDGHPRKRWEIVRWADVDHLENLGTIGDS